MKHTVYLFLFLLAALLPAAGQTVKQLENERKATLQQLETTNKMLGETQRSQQSSLRKLNLLTASIRERRSLISTINREVTSLDTEIRDLERQQRDLKQRLEVVRADYARLVQEAYINRGTEGRLVFLLSGESFGQSLRRLRYLQEYASYRKDQAEEITRLTAEIARRSETAGQHRLTRLGVLQQKEAEAKKLAGDQQRENRMLADLKKKEKTLRTQLAAQQKKAARLNDRIEQLIAEEIRREEERRKKEQQQSAQAKTAQPAAKPAPTGVNALTKEEKLVNGNFEANRGRLPWPVERGVITGKFGLQPHPVLKAVTTNNKGIYIETPSGAEARAVFDGVVTQCFAIPGNNNAVIVRHGVYRTVYANLTALYVKEGDQVKAKQPVGKIYTDALHDNNTELYFQLWKEKTLLNPEPWLTK